MKILERKYLKTSEIICSLDFLYFFKYHSVSFYHKNTNNTNNFGQNSNNQATHIYKYLFAKSVFLLFDCFKFVDLMLPLYFHYCIMTVFVITLFMI